MDANRAAADAWGRHLDEIQGWVDEMDALLGKPGDNDLDRARATEIAAFRPEEQGTEWVRSEATGDLYYYWAGDFAHTVRLGIEVRTGFPGLGERSSPRIYFLRHRRAIESALEDLDRVFAGPEDAEFFRTGVARLKERFDLVRAGILQCALPAFVEQARLKQMRLERSRRNRALDPTIFNPPSQEERARALAERERLWAEIREIERQIDEAAERFDGCVGPQNRDPSSPDAAPRSVSDAVARDVFGRWTPPPQDDRAVTEGDADFRARVGDGEDSLVDVLAGKDQGLLVRGIVTSGTEGLGTVLSRLEADARGVVGEAEILVFARQRRIVERSDVPAPGPSWPRLAVPPGAARPLDADEGDRRNVELQPKVFLPFTVVTRQGRVLLMRGLFPERGDLRVEINGRPVDAVRRKGDEVRVLVPDDVEGDAKVVVAIDGIRSEEEEFDALGRARAGEPATTRIARPIAEAGLDAVLRSDKLRRTLGLFVNAVRGRGHLRTIFASSTDRDGGERGLILIDVDFRRRFKDFTVTIKAVAGVPRGVSDRLLHPDDPYYQELSKEAYDVIRVDRRGDDFEVTFVKPGPLPLDLGIKYDKDAKQLDLGPLGLIDLEQELGLTAGFNFERKTLTLKKRFTDDPNRSATLDVESAVDRLGVTVEQRNEVDLGDRTVRTVLRFAYDEDEEDSLGGSFEIGGTVAKLPLLPTALDYSFKGVLGDGLSLEGSLTLTRLDLDGAQAIADALPPGRSPASQDLARLRTKDTIRLTGSKQRVQRPLVGTRRTETVDVYSVALDFSTGTSDGRYGATAGASLTYEDDTFTPSMRASGQIRDLTSFDLNLDAGVEGKLVYGRNGNRITQAEVTANLGLELDLGPLDVEARVKGTLRRVSDVAADPYYQFEAGAEVVVDRSPFVITFGCSSVLGTQSDPNDDDLRFTVDLEIDGIVGSALELVGAKKEHRLVGPPLPED